LQEAAISAAAPASYAALSVYDSASRHVTMTCQHNDLPFCHGTSVTPSGHFPSVRSNPTGSFVTGTPAPAKLRVTKLTLLLLLLLLFYHHRHYLAYRQQLNGE